VVLTIAAACRSSGANDVSNAGANNTNSPVTAADEGSTDVAMSGRRRKGFAMKCRMIQMIAVVALLAAACGGSGSDDAEGAQSNDPVAADGGSSSFPDGVPTVDDLGLDLPTTPISMQEAIVDDWAGATVQLDSCSLLTDATLESSLSVDGTAATLDRASGTECNWTAFPGTFSVRMERAADVEVDDHSDRAYNIDIEPIVEPQDGPGEKAVILVDTAFSDGDAAEGVVYAFFFVLDGQAVTLRSSGVSIGERQAWRVMADEVAANLTAAGDSGDASEAGEAAPDSCTMYSVSDVAAIIGIEEAEISTEHNLETHHCTWKAGNYSLSLGFTSGDGSPPFDEMLAADPDKTSYFPFPVAWQFGSYYLPTPGDVGLVMFRVDTAREDATLAMRVAIAENLTSRIVD